MPLAECPGREPAARVRQHAGIVPAIHATMCRTLAGTLRRPPVGPPDGFPSTRAYTGAPFDPRDCQPLRLLRFAVFPRSMDASVVSEGDVSNGVNPSFKDMEYAHPIAFRGLREGFVQGRSGRRFDGRPGNWPGPGLFHLFQTRHGSQNCYRLPGRAKFAHRGTFRPGNRATRAESKLVMSPDPDDGPTGSSWCACPVVCVCWLAATKRTC